VAAEGLLSVTSIASKVFNKSRDLLTNKKPRKYSGSCSDKSVKSAWALALRPSGMGMNDKPKTEGGRGGGRPPKTLKKKIRRLKLVYIAKVFFLGG